MTSAANMPRKPSRTTRRGETWGKSFGIPAAARIRVKERGSNRTPVSIAERPSATERKSGIAKKRPPCSRYWKKNELRPARRVFVRRIAGSTSGSPPRAITRFSQVAKSQITMPPARISQIVGESPIHSGPPCFGLTNPQVPERRMPKTISPSPTAERAVPTRSRWTFFSGTSASSGG